MSIENIIPDDIHYVLPWLGDKPSEFPETELGEWMKAAWAYRDAYFELKENYEIIVLKLVKNILQEEIEKEESIIDEDLNLVILSGGKYEKAQIKDLRRTVIRTLLRSIDFGIKK